MEKYKFTRDFDYTSPAPSCARIPPYCSYIPFRKSFKKGDIIEGNVENSLAMGYIKTSMLVNGMVKIPLNTKDTPLEKVLTADLPQRQIDSVKSSSKEKSDSYFTTKNVLIGLVLVGSIYGLLKFTKIIK